jgi:hypothetical protein
VTDRPTIATFCSVAWVKGTGARLLPERAPVEEKYYKKLMVEDILS